MEEQEIQDPNQPSYWCFLSYRHADNKAQDRDWASWLHQEIERYEVPAELVGTTNERGDVLPERIYPVFRDEESLPADADLAHSIVNALNRSRFMVVLCSPRAVESKYVAQEVRHFKRSGKDDRILAAILDGEPGSDGEECFPMPLRHPMGPNGELNTSQIIEPIAADFRLRDGSQGFTSSQAYRLHLAKEGSVNKRRARELADLYERQLQLMKLKIIAGILGVPLEQLRNRDKAYQLDIARKRARKLRGWLAAVSLLAIVAGLLGFLAEKNRRTAETQKGIAESEADRATRARLRSDRQTLSALTSTSRVLLSNGDQIEALRAAVKAGILLKQVPELSTKSIPWYEATIALRKAVYETREINRLQTNRISGLDVAFSGDGRTLMMVDTGEGLIDRWSAEGKDLGSFETGHHGAIDYCAAISAFVWSTDGEKLVTVGTQGDVKLWGADNEPLADGFTVPARGGGDCNSVSGVHVDFTEELMIVVDNAGTVSWWSWKGEKIKEFEAAPVPWLRSGSVFSRQGTHLATYQDGKVLIWDLSAMTLLNGFEAPQTEFLQFDVRGESLWTMNQRGAVHRVALNGEILAEFGPADGAFDDDQSFGSCFSVGPQGIVACGESSGQLYLWTAEGELVANFDPHPGRMTGSVSFNADGAKFITSSSDGSEVRIWNTTTERAPRLNATETAVTNQQVSPDGNVVASIGGTYSQLIELCDREGRQLVSFDAGQLPNADFSEGTISVAVSPEGNLVASGGADGTAKLWDLNGTLLRTIKAHRDYARAWFSNDGQILITISDSGTGFEGEGGSGEIKLWDLNGRLLETLPTEIGIGEAGFTADGKKLIARGKDETRDWNFDLDDLLRRGARKLDAYLANHPDMTEDRTLCAEIESLFEESIESEVRPQ